MRNNGRVVAAHNYASGTPRNGASGVSVDATTVMQVEAGVVLELVRHRRKHGSLEQASICRCWLSIACLAAEEDLLIRLFQVETRLRFMGFGQVLHAQQNSLLEPGH